MCSMPAIGPTHPNLLRDLTENKEVIGQCLTYGNVLDTLQRHATSRKRPAATSKPIEIEGTRYFSVATVARAVGVSRQTVWRWRLDGKIPPGHLYRNHQTVFTSEEVNAVREFANKVEPIEGGPARQLRLFNGAAKGEQG